MHNGSVDASKPAGRPDAEDIAEVADLIVSVARKISAHEPDVGVVRLSGLEILILRCVDRRPGVTPSELALELGLKSSNTSATLRTLESRGLLRRTADPNDRRSVHIEPTPQLAENRKRIRDGWVHVMESRIPDGYDLGTIVRFLTELDDAFVVRG